MKTKAQRISLVVGLISLCLYITYVILKEGPSSSLQISVSTETQKNDYTALRTELAKVEKRDFVGYKGQWCVVTAVHHMNIDKENAIFARPKNSNLSHYLLR